MVSDHQFQLFLVNCVYFETTSFGKNCTKKYVLTLITLIVFIWFNILKILKTNLQIIPCDEHLQIYGLCHLLICFVRFSINNLFMKLYILSIMLEWYSGRSSPLHFRFTNTKISQVKRAQGQFNAFIHLSNVCTIFSDSMHKHFCNTCYQSLISFKRLLVGHSLSHCHWRNVIVMFLLFVIATTYSIGLVFVFCSLQKKRRLILLQISVFQDEVYFFRIKYIKRCVKQCKEWSVN